MIEQNDVFKDKYIDFMLTESEVLIKLVNEAIKKGEKLRKDITRLQKVSEKILESLSEYELFSEISELHRAKPEYNYVVGIDGSCQLVGGLGGKWYAPISVVRVILKDCFVQGKFRYVEPNVDIFWAKVIEINEPVDGNPARKAILYMLAVETKALSYWSRKGYEHSLILLDGPVVDPPSFYGETERKYAVYRCKSILRCLSVYGSEVIGCVKRIRDRFFIAYLSDILDEELKSRLKDFINDYHVLAHLFLNFRFSIGDNKTPYSGPLFTRPIDLGSVSDTYRFYRKHGVRVLCSFFQKSIASPILRIDISLPEQSYEEKRLELPEIIKAIDELIYPGQEYPYCLLYTSPSPRDRG